MNSYPVGPMIDSYHHTESYRLRRLADLLDEHERVCIDLYVRGRRGETILPADTARLTRLGAELRSARNALELT